MFSLLIKGTQRKYKARGKSAISFELVNNHSSYTLATMKKTSKHFCGNEISQQIHGHNEQIKVELEEGLYNNQKKTTVIAFK